MLSSKNQPKGTRLSVSGASAKTDHPRLGVNKAAAAKTAAPADASQKEKAPKAAKRPKRERGSGGSSRTSGSGKLIKIVLAVVVVVIIAGGAWWFLGGKSPAQPTPVDGPALPQRTADMPQTIEYVHNDINISYKVGQPVAGTYIVLGYNSWEQNQRRFSDGHISLLPLAKAQELYKQYGNLYDGGGDTMAMQAIRAVSLNMPYIYNEAQTPGVAAGLKEIAAQFRPESYLAIQIKGHFLTYEKGSLSGRDMPAPEEQSGVSFNFVNFEEVKVVNANWPGE